MHRFMLSTALGLALAVAACTKAERQDTANDVQAAADRIGDEAKDAANSPEVKKAGAELKDAAGDAVDVTKSALKGAAEGAREGMAKVESGANETRDDAKAEH